MKIHEHIYEETGERGEYATVADAIRLKCSVCGAKAFKTPYSDVIYRIPTAKSIAK